MKDAIKLLPADEKVRVIALFHLFLKKSEFDGQFDKKIEEIEKKYEELN